MMEEELIELGSPTASKRVILLHGLTGTASVIRPVAEYLCKRLGEDYSFLLPTAPIIKVKQFSGEPAHAWFDVKSSDFRREADIDGIFESSDRIASLVRNEISQGVSPKDIYPKLSRAKVYRASEKPEALFYGEASAEGGNPVTMSISF